MNLSNSQKAMKRFLSPYTPYQSLLLFYGTGVGKTCTAITIAEQFREKYNSNIFIIGAESIQKKFQKNYSIWIILKIMILNLDAQAKSF